MNIICSVFGVYLIGSHVKRNSLGRIEFTQEVSFDSSNEENLYSKFLFRRKKNQEVGMMQND